MAEYRLEQGNWPIPDGTREVEWAVFKEGESKPLVVTFDKNMGELIVECFNKEAIKETIRKYETITGWNYK